MTEIKLCGLSRISDIEVANYLEPEYIGFVFAKRSKRYISPEKARILRRLVKENIKVVGVFVNENPNNVSKLLSDGIIDIAQLHGEEDEEYIAKLRAITDKLIIKAFRIGGEEDLIAANRSSADYILLDSDAGSGRVFDWKILKNFTRPYFLAGGLNTSNVKQAVKLLGVFGVDVSSSIESNGLKDKAKMLEFVSKVRKED